jgi:hypothetical protein
LRAEIENPFTGKPHPMRQFLSWTLDELRPLAEALGLWNELTPLVEMANGAPNTAERLRQRLQTELRARRMCRRNCCAILAEERTQQVTCDVEWIAEAEAGKAGRLSEFLQHARRRPGSRCAGALSVRAARCSGGGLC